MVDAAGSVEWALAPAERELVMSKSRANRLRFALLLTFFRERGWFPRDAADVEMHGIAELCKQLDVPAPVDGEAFLTGRTAERLRAEIRVRFGFSEATVANASLVPRCGLTRTIFTLMCTRAYRRRHASNWMPWCARKKQTATPTRRTMQPAVRPRSS